MGEGSVVDGPPGGGWVVDPAPGSVVAGPVDGVDPVGSGEKGGTDGAGGWGCGAGAPTWSNSASTHEAGALTGLQRATVPPGIPTQYSVVKPTARPGTG